jgi:hypothetical protein
MTTAKLTLRGGRYDGRTLNRPSFMKDGYEGHLVVSERVQRHHSFSLYAVAGDEAHYTTEGDTPWGGYYVPTSMLDQRDPFGTSAHEAIENFMGQVPPDLDWREYLYDEPVELTALSSTEHMDEQNAAFRKMEATDGYQDWSDN